MINKMSKLPPLERFLRTPMNDRDSLLSFFRYFRAFSQYELFVSFRSLNFGFKINRIIPLLVIISSKLPASTNVIHKLLWALQTIPNDNFKNCKVPHSKSTDLNRIQVTTLTCCNVQVKQNYYETRNQGGRSGAETSPAKFFAPLGKMCWA